MSQNQILIMSNIITVTLNTAIDHVLTFDTLTLGENQVAQGNVVFAAGKGVNVAKALESLGQPVSTLGFVGQQTRGYYDALQSPLLQTDFIYLPGNTRSNITLSTLKPLQETHIRTTGYNTTVAGCKQLTEKLTVKIQPGDIIVLSGSLPSGVPPDLYTSLISVCHSQGAIVFLDSSGESLKAAISARPDVIKPNQHELEELTGISLLDEQAILKAAQALIAQGIKQVVVSRGSKGALLVTDRLTLNATVAYPFGPIISTIGCGDAMVAGLALATLKQSALNATLRLAVACGTANLFTDEPGRFDKQLLTGISRYITINELFVK